MQVLKVMTKGMMALTVIALLTVAFTELFDSAYDLRLVLAAAGGAFGYRSLYKLFSRIKGLE